MVSELEKEALMDNFASLSVNLPGLLQQEKKNILDMMTSSYKSQLLQVGVQLGNAKSGNCELSISTYLEQIMVIPIVLYMSTTILY